MVGAERNMQVGDGSAGSRRGRDHPPHLLPLLRRDGRQADERMDRSLCGESVRQRLAPLAGKKSVERLAGDARSFRASRGIGAARSGPSSGFEGGRAHRQHSRQGCTEPAAARAIRATLALRANNIAIFNIEGSRPARN